MEEALLHAELDELFSFFFSAPFCPSENDECCERKYKEKYLNQPYATNNHAKDLVTEITEIFFFILMFDVNIN